MPTFFLKQVIDRQEWIVRMFLSGCVVQALLLKPLVQLRQISECSPFGEEPLAYKC